MIDRQLSAVHVGQLLSGAGVGPGGPAYRGLADALRGLVLDGRVPPNTRLPSERSLAVELGVSRNTVTAALDLLRGEGFLGSRQGSGSWTTLPPDAGQRPDEPLPPPGDVIDLTVAALPAPPALAALAVAAAAELPAELRGHGYEPYGLRALRAAVAERLTRRGLPTSPAEVLITQGAMHAWSLVLDVLVARGDPVLVETPTYPAALDALRSHGARPVPVSISRTGWDMRMMRATLRRARPRVAFLIPDFHNPTGALVSAAQRDALRHAARATDTLLVADETFVELDLDGGQVPPPLGAGGQSPPVLTIGSLSKSCWAGLRVGWIRGDARLLGRLADARARRDVGSPILDGLLAVHALRALDSLLEERRRLLRGQRDALFAALAAHHPDWIVESPRGGLSLWVQLPQATSSALAREALAHGVRLAPGSRFDASGLLERHLRLPYTQPRERLVEAMRRLRQARPAAESATGDGARSARWVA